MKNKMLSQSIADTLLSMITIEKRFLAGDKLPNENELSAELNVSRTTLTSASFLCRRCAYREAGKIITRLSELFCIRQIKRDFPNGIHIIG